MKDSRPSRSSPPGPRGWPWVGCVDALLRDPMAFFTTIARRYGGITHIPLKGGRSVYLVSEPSLIKELLWRCERRATQPAFKLTEIDRHLGWMTAAIENFLDRWTPMAWR